MAFLHHLLRKTHIPEWVTLFVPRQSEYIVQESNFASSLHVILVLEAVNFFLENFAGGLWHSDNLVKFFLVFGLVTLLVVFQNALVSMFQKTCLGSLFEFFCSLLDVIKFFVDNLMHLVIKINHSTAAMQWVSRLNKGVYHGAHSFVVLTEDRLEDGEVEMSHLENNLIEDVKVGSPFGVLVYIK